MSTKEKIARATVELIALRGVDAVSMRDIAGKIGLSEAALYRHFSSKNALVWEAFTTHYDVFAENLSQRQAEQTTFKAKLNAMVAGCCDVFDEDQDLFTFLMLAQHIQRSAPQEYEAALPKLVEQLLTEAIEKREIPDQDVFLTTAMMMGAVLQTALYCIYSKTQPKLMNSVFDKLSQACWRIVNG